MKRYSVAITYNQENSVYITEKVVEAGNEFEAVRKALEEFDTTTRYDWVSETEWEELPQKENENANSDR